MPDSDHAECGLAKEDYTLPEKEVKPKKVKAKEVEAPEAEEK